MLRNKDALYNASVMPLVLSSLLPFSFFFVHNFLPICSSIPSPGSALVFIVGAIYHVIWQTYAYQLVVVYFFCLFCVLGLHKIKRLVAFVFHTGFISFIGTKKKRQTNNSFAFEKPVD